MRILLVTPAADPETPGNGVTAERWAAFLRELGHEAEVRSIGSDGAGADPDLADVDVLVALHARKSLGSILRFDDRRRGRGDRPASGLVVALTGTDLYGDLEDPSSPAWEALERADRVIVLQERAPDALPPALRAKTRVLYQSVPELWDAPEAAGSGGPHLRICVLAHLRPVKDPLLAAEAARRLPADSRVRIDHYGSAHGAGGRKGAQAARRASRENPRYRWHGEVPRPEALRRLARSDLFLLTSRLEGAGNATSEAITLRLPVLCSRIPGLEGMVGVDYPGLFAPGDAGGLADLLRRAERDPDFLALLRDRVTERRPLLDPARERAGWESLLAEIPPTA